mmetsp:Transcript_7442/g.15311  ORF Transcript_7442/g.15311 Transcript_7442/m.15311 type:complete len:238 (+) Transcript_7442:1254-1967(+)
MDNQRNTSRGILLLHTRTNSNKISSMKVGDIRLQPCLRHRLHSRIIRRPDPTTHFQPAQCSFPLLQFPTQLFPHLAEMLDILQLRRRSSMLKISSRLLPQRRKQHRRIVFRLHHRRKMPIRAQKLLQQSNLLSLQQTITSLSHRPLPKVILAPSQPRIKLYHLHLLIAIFLQIILRTFLCLQLHLIIPLTIFLQRTILLRQLVSRQLRFPMIMLTSNLLWQATLWNLPQRRHLVMSS